MKQTFLFLSVFCLLTSAINVNAQRSKKITGEGEVTTQPRSVSDFDQVHSRGSFNIVLTDASSKSVKVEAEQNLQEYVEVEVKNGELIISNKKNYELHPKKDITVYVSAPAFKRISSSGSGNITTTNTLNGSDNVSIRTAGSGNIAIDIETSLLKTSIAGSGNVTLKGKTSDFEGSIAGSGNIKAKELQSANTSVRISGSGNAEVVATQKLTSHIAGSGDIKYWGNASLDSKVMGSGTIRRQN